MPAASVVRIKPLYSYIRVLSPIQRDLIRPDPSCSYRTFLSRPFLEITSTRVDECFMCLHSCATPLMNAAYRSLSWPYVGKHAFPHPTSTDMFASSRSLHAPSFGTHDTNSPQVYILRVVRHSCTVFVLLRTIKGYHPAVKPSRKLTISTRLELRY